MAESRAGRRLRAFLEAHAAATGAPSLYAAALDVGRAEDVRATALVTFNGFLVAALAVITSAFFAAITAEVLFLALLGLSGVLIFFATTFSVLAIGDGQPAVPPDIEGDEIEKLAKRITVFRAAFLFSWLGAVTLAAFIGGLVGYGAGA